MTPTGGSPYDDLPPRAYWRSGVVRRRPGAMSDLHEPRFAIGATTAVMTAGSCFAQHVHRALKAQGWNVIDEEPSPDGVPADVAARFFYGTFSARYGNVYTARQFLQLLREAYCQFTPGNAVWERDGRFFDALRPNVEPEGFGSSEALALAREDHLAAVCRAVVRAEVLVFTLGLTETWEDVATGTVYPTAPGVIAGAHDPARVRFLNLSHDAVVADLRAVLALLREVNPGLKLLLTVSPVPLTATASGAHVLVASTLSKAVLRSAAATLMAGDAGVDYFPSYEIITNPAARGGFMGPNLRQPTQKGVDVVMGTFLAAHQPRRRRKIKSALRPASQVEEDSPVICEEMLIEARQT